MHGRFKALLYFTQNMFLTSGMLQYDITIVWYFHVTCFSFLPQAPFFLYGATVMEFLSWPYELAASFLPDHALAAS